jgi:hypothetical protein
MAANTFKSIVIGSKSVSMGVTFLFRSLKSKDLRLFCVYGTMKMPATG